MTLIQSQIEGLPLVHRGKVRETYAVGDDRLLLVATDRLSAFDVVFDQPIPDKGRVLNALSAWWFARLVALGPTHFLSADAGQLPTAATGPELAGRVMLVRRAQRIDAECVVRGYLAGSGWVEYQRSGLVGGSAAYRPDRARPEAVVVDRKSRRFMGRILQMGPTTRAVGTG